MSAISSEIKGGVLILRLNRPEKFNSFNRAMALSLIELLSRAASMPDVRCVMLTGEGKAFCAGQDLSEAIDKEGPGIRRIVEEHYNPIIIAIRKMPKPVVAAVNGVAAGAGANIALACDIVLAARSAAFIQAFSKIGLIPDSGGTYTLPRLVGMQLASALMFTGDKLSAEDARAFGMVYKVIDDGQLAEKALELCTQLAAMPTKALARTKQLLNDSYGNSLEAQLKAEGEQQVLAAAGSDYSEGVNAFLEKRKAIFKGE